MGEGGHIDRACIMYNMLTWRGVDVKPAAWRRVKRKKGRRWTWRRYWK